jgi:hypothetical protein
MVSKKKNIYNINTLNIDKNILKTITKYLNVKEKEKHLFGEVFTNIELIIEMLDKLPKNVWSNPKLKWLDPANGIGNFPIIIYYKLMEGLKNVKGLTNTKKRSKHIIEQMLFMVELNPKNVIICKKIFYILDSKSRPNIYNKNFLEWSIKINNKFNIIIGNPPYNEGGTGRTTGSRQPLWPKFIDSSMSLLEANGYLLFITPKGWRKPYNLEKSKNIGRILLNFINDGSMYYINLTDRIIANFPPIDYYIYTKQKKINTIIDSSFNTISSIGYSINLNNFVNSSKTNFLPSIMNKDIVSILSKLFKKYNKNNNYSLKYDGTLDANKKMLDNPKNAIPFAFYHKDGKYIEVYNKDINGRVKDYYKKPKIVCTFNGANPIGYLYPVFYKKPIATTTFTMYQLLDDTSEKNVTKHINFLSSKLILAILKLTQYSPPPRNKNDHKIINLIQIPNLPSNPTNKDIYNYYNITKSEQILIEKICKEFSLKKTKKVKKF